MDSASRWSLGDACCLSFSGFMLMWSAMMAAMMLPIVAPALWRCRTPLPVALGYFLVWSASGAIIYPLEGWLSQHTGGVLLLAGGLQLTRWKMQQLERCRANDRRGSFLDGLQLGLRCSGCCVPLTLALVAVSMMDLRAMLAATALIALERLAPAQLRSARRIGFGLLAMGALSLLGPSLFTSGQGTRTTTRDEQVAFVRVPSGTAR